MAKLKFFKKRKKVSTLDEYRAVCGIETQRELAEKLGIPESVLSRHITGIRKFSKEVGLKVSRKTGIPMERLYQ